MQADITLVHGTFQPDAAWTIPEKSSLCRFLGQELGSGIRFHRSVWSGKNTHAARLLAARQLRSELRSRLEQDPSVPQFVIGHSHGGSVISYALQEDEELREKIAGIVLLATPFIQVRRRSLGPALLLPVFLGLAIGLWKLFTLYGHTFRSFSADWPWLLREGLGSILGIGVLVAALFAITTVVHLFLPGRRGLPDRMEKHASKVLPTFECDRLPADRTLIVRTSADEASSGLAMLQVLSRILGDVSAWFARLLYIPMRWLAAPTPAQPGPGDAAEPKAAPAPAAGRDARVIGALRLVSMLTCMLLLFGRGLLRKVPALVPPMDWLDAVGDWLNSAWGWSFDVLTIAVIVVLVQLVVATPFMLLLARGFGIPPSLFVFFLDVSVEATPPGRWEVHQVRLDDETAHWKDVNPLELAHSRSYGDPRVHALIRSWMADRLALPVAGPGGGERSQP